MYLTNTIKHLDKLLLVGFSVLFFWPTFKWLRSAFFGLYDSINLFLFISISLLLYLHRKKHAFSFQPLSFRILPFILVCISITGYVYIQNLWGINFIMTLFFILFLFGVLGFYVSSETWIKSIIPFLLITMTLPFGNLMDVYIGFPLRLLAVDFIHNLFSGLGIENLTKDSIITIENNAAQIDFSCSGLKGLWAGLLFFFTLSWINSLRFGLSWLTAFIAYLFLLIGANIIRISIIIYISFVLNAPEWASTFHSALGLIGFIFSSALIYFLTTSKTFKRINQKGWSVQTINFKILPTKNIHLPYANWLFVIALGIGLLGRSQSKKSYELNPISIEWPSNWKTEELSVTPLERDFLKQQGGDFKKLTFNFKNQKGSILLIKSKGWRSHHNPEYCIRAGGHQIDEINTVLLNEQTSIKWMKVNGNASACYWFQSPDGVTDDFSTRIWSEVKEGQKDWMLVSVVFNETIENSITQQIILTKIHHLINNYFLQTHTS